jgi:predicted amidophosphoribosyltransferase
LGVKKLNTARIFSPVPFSLHDSDCGRTFAFFRYKDAFMKRCLWDFKYYLEPDAISFIADVYSDEMIAILSDTVNMLPLGAPAYIIHAPSSSFTSGKRAWDQMHELSKTIAARMNIDNPFMSSLDDAILFNDFVRTEKSQHESSRSERLNSSKDKFCLSGEFCEILSIRRGSKVICIDDVTTTGATLSSICGLVKKYSDVELVCMALCH